MDDNVIVGEAEEILPYDDIEYDLDIVSYEDWIECEIGEYPVNESSEIWKNLSYNEAIAACDMPKEFAETLTTDELIQYALNYPFLMDTLFFDNIEDGFSVVTQKSGIFKELFCRDDCISKLINTYESLKVDYNGLEESGDVSSTNYDSQLFIEIYVELNLEKLSDAQVNSFVDEYEEKYIDMGEENQFHV